MSHSPQALAARIVDVFARTGREIGADRAHSLACEIAAYGGLDSAVAALANDDACAALGDALAFTAALAELADPAVFAARLLREARDPDARATPIWAEANALHGRAAYRRAQGEMELADQFHGRALAGERLATEYETDAFAKRLKAAELKADGDLRMLAWALTALAA